MKASAGHPRIWCRFQLPVEEHRSRRNNYSPPSEFLAALARCPPPGTLERGAAVVAFWRAEPA
jgi:hypothetical protein